MNQRKKLSISTDVAWASGKRVPTVEKLSDEQLKASQKTSTSFSGTSNVPALPGDIVHHPDGSVTWFTTAGTSTSYIREAKKKLAKQLPPPPPSRLIKESATPAKPYYVKRDGGKWCIFSRESKHFGYDTKVVVDPATGSLYADSYMHARRVCAEMNNKRFSQKHSDVEDFSAFMDALGSSK